MACDLVLCGKRFVWVVWFPNRVMRWLNTQTPASVVLIYLDSRYFMSEQRQQHPPLCRAHQIRPRVVDLCNSCSAIGFAGCRFPIRHGHPVGCSYPS
jgi:hypothetical protein